MDQRDLNDFLYDFLYGPILNNGLLYNSLYFFDSISVDNFLYNDFDLDWFFDNVMNLNNFLYDLWNFDDFLHRLNDGNNFFDDSVHRLIPDLNVVSNVWSWHILYSLDNLLNNFLDLYDFGHFNSNLYNLLYDLVYWDWFFDDLSGSDYFLSD